MRNQLTPFIGKDVVVVGHCVSQRQNENWYYQCIQNARVYLYNENRKLDLDKPVAVVQHLWMRNSQCKKDEFYTKMLFTGKVVEYERNNGTTDIGVYSGKHLLLRPYKTLVEEVRTGSTKNLSTEDLNTVLVSLRTMKNNLNKCKKNGHPVIDLTGRLTPKSSFYETYTALSREIHTLENRVG